MHSEMNKNYKFVICTIIMTLRGKHNLIYKFRTWRNEDRDNIVRLQFWHVLALTERHRFVSLHVSHQPVEYLNIAVYRDVNLLGVSLTLSTLKVSLNNLATVNASCTKRYHITVQELWVGGFWRKDFESLSWGIECLLRIDLKCRSEETLPDMAMTWNPFQKEDVQPLNLKSMRALFK